MLAAEAFQNQAVTHCLELLREIDSVTWGVLKDTLPTLQLHLVDERACCTLIETMCQLSMEAPNDALALSQRLVVEPELVKNINSLRKWVLYGLAAASGNPSLSSKYFQFGHPQVFDNGHAEADLSYLQARSASLIHYFTGFGCQLKSVELFGFESAEFSKRAAVIDRVKLLLPRSVLDFSWSERDHLSRATAAHIAAHLKYSPLPRNVGNRRPMLVALTGLLEDARVERLMLQEHPGLGEVWGAYHTASKSSAGFQFDGLAARLSRALYDPGYQDKNDWVTKGRTGFEQIAIRDLHDVAAFDRLARELSIQMGRMRQAVPENYQVEPAYRDDNSILWVMPTDSPVDETISPGIDLIEGQLNDEVSEEIDLSGLDLRPRFHYPEWDCQLGEMRKDWVTVKEHKMGGQGRSLGGLFVAAPQRCQVHGLDRTPDRSVRLNRQAEGDEFDLNSVIASTVQRRLKMTPDTQIYRRHGRRRRTTAALLLMDMSISTRRFVPGSFTTVMDAEKRAAFVVARALDQRHDRVAIHGFSSNGRHEVNYNIIKGFDDPFDEARQANLTSLTGDLSTRMGAALRHASWLLAREATDQKVILVLTDGEPSDIDVIEDDYLVEDARNAVDTASGSGIRTFCLTLDRRADEYVHRIFGMRNYLISDHADSFAGWAGQTLVKLVAQ